MSSPAPSVKKALQDATTQWPGRSKLSDGAMGDAAHKKRKSDHNDGNAFDITHDPINGPDCNEWSKVVINDPRVKYVIWNKEIYVVKEGVWKEYRGSNPHNKHMHVSIHASSRDDISPWPWLTRNADSSNTDKYGKSIICWPIPSNNQGSEFANQEEILSHLGGESTGLYMIGRNGMWHGGIHITSATTPWCGLSGKAASERIDFPVPFKGEQAVRCMADGEVVAYRVCKDYMQIKWETGPLSISGSFVLVKHYIQPGEKETSGLHFYTLYMHLAPYSAYTVNPAETKWTVKDTLSAYDPEWVMTASTNNKGTSESYKKGTMPKGAIVEWDKSDSSLHTVAFNKREYGLVTYVGLTEDAQQRGKKTTLKPGQQYWMLVDKNNISPGTDGLAQPSWWQQLLPPAKETMKFDQVVCPAPYAISAGDPVGHMGYYQAAKDGGYEPRYQVHIECMSMDDNLETFLTNPEKVGEKNPLYLKYSPGLALFTKDLAAGTFIKGKKTERTGILTLSQVTTEADKTTKQEYWQLRPENAYASKGAAEPELLSQYDLAKLGFRTEIAEPSSFDYLDGKTQPTGFFRSVIDSLYSAAKDDTRASHALVKHNYQRLLDKIDSGALDYSSLEYASAFHNLDYRDVTLKTIVKHPSDWYFKKDDAIWQPFLNALKKEAPEWKKYSETFLDKMAWMQDVTTEKLGPSLWHMHPLVFLGSFIQRDKIIWMKKFTEKFGSTKAEAFRSKLLEVSEELSIDPNYIMACIALETGKTFRTDIKNPGSSATGLIQFMKDTAIALGTTTRQLRVMDHVEQMEYVKKYFKMQASNIGVSTDQWTLEDVYYSIFRPKTILLEPNDIVYQRSDGDYYSKNLYHDRNSDGKITKNEIAENIRINYKQGIPEAG
ncbi:hypothetical protein [Buttiauxella sp. S04-F03]|uniref:hypothetical protein n=1 Tax=Buttiauxella sp. S04-F03 TaxID=2904525 RepID=UPI001E348B1F|nr:hypothetical protein [Buttiauxella sp. S04-F03]MCE0814096.1 hypothetical protein [Buttiauxella sp. S04-F03]